MAQITTARVDSLFLELGLPAPVGKEREAYTTMPEAAFGAFATAMRTIDSRARAAASLSSAAIYAARTAQGSRNLQ